MKKLAPEISVIMPVYNSGQFLEESIESILNQTFTNFEFIIIDDKSNDNSKEIISNYMIKDNRIILIENEDNLGVAAARNRGLEIARGKYIALMDSDDISLPNRLEKEYLFLENNPEFFLVGSSGIRIDEKGNKLENINYCEDLTIKGKVYCILASSIMFRNEGIMFREKFHYAEDFDFYLRLITLGYKLTNIEDILIKIRMRTSSITMTTRTRGDFFHEKAVKFYNQRLETGTDDYEKFDEKEIFSIPLDDSRRRYLKSVIGLSLKNGEIDAAKENFQEYKELISSKRRLLYQIAFAFPFIYSLRLKIKSLLKEKN